MLHSIATVSISGLLDEKIKAIADAGFHGVEIFENDLITYSGTPRDVAALLKEVGLVCTCYQPFRDFEGMPDGRRKAVFERMKRKFEVMKELGAPMLLVCSNISPDSLGDRSRIIDDFSELGELAAEYDVKVGYEALAWGRHINDHRDVWDVVKAVNHPNIGIILDSFHSLARNIPIESLLEIDPAKIALVQLADAPLLDMDLLYWSRHFRNMPGQGDLDVEGYVKALTQIGYDGVISLEIFNDRFRAGHNSRIALDGRRSLIFLEERICSTGCRDRIDTEGVGFVEFAANDSEAQALSGFLSSAGFRLTGRHKSKQVERWSQGSANIIINGEADGFAHSFNLTNGCSVCAIGVVVADRDQALQRARNLLIPVFEEEVGASEYKMPAIRGAGGSLLYFMDKQEERAIWNGEFNEVEETNRTQDFVLEFDHIAQTMDYEDMLSWLLYYYTLFNVEKTPQIELTDPLGVVLSQAVQSPIGGLRITMNGSSAPQTLASRSLDNYLGAGVQHIAFKTKDIFETARMLEAGGAQMLPIPANYYDDLKARFDLEAPIVEQMRRSNILFDRTESGDYWQVYTRAFNRRFFFEFVQRNQYDGYGAANASVRIAAQSRFRKGSA